VTSPGLTFVLTGLIFKFLRMRYETRIIWTDKDKIMKFKKTLSEVKQWHGSLP
jgi:hypothetical protein